MAKLGFENKFDYKGRSYDAIEITLVAQTRDLAEKEVRFSLKVRMTWFPNRLNVWKRGSTEVFLYATEMRRGFKKRQFGKTFQRWRFWDLCSISNMKLLIPQVHLHVWRKAEQLGRKRSIWELTARRPIMWYWLWQIMWYWLWQSSDAFGHQRSSVGAAIRLWKAKSLTFLFRLRG